MATLDFAPQQWLLARARAAIAAHLTGAAAPPLAAAPPEAATERRGCFVSLHHASGDLRGCIGTFEDTDPLWRQVEAMGVAAATRDPRFVPLVAAELVECRIEVSALTPRHPLGIDEVEVGRHGLWVERGAYRGVLLPQVATAHGWDAPTFLRQTCLKAGLPADAWHDPKLKLMAFEAEVFAEA